MTNEDLLDVVVSVAKESGLAVSMKSVFKDGFPDEVWVTFLGGRFDGVAVFVTGTESWNSDYDQTPSVRALLHRAAAAASR